MSERKTVFVKTIAASELGPNQSRMVALNGKNIVLFNLKGQFFGTSDKCPHQGGSIADGEISSDSVICPVLAARFEIKTGKCLSGPVIGGVAQEPCKDLKKYAVRVINNHLEVEV
jgi:nitrite reductase/ring-hydroxylating ferredoxin subunit